MDRVFFLLVILGASLQGSLSQQGRRRPRQPQCERGSCYPATGDLLIGRELNLTASSTCGSGGESRYCVVSYLEDDKKCFKCDSRQPFSDMSHRVDNIVSFRNRRKWWQAENGVEKVSIQLDLEAEFHFTHLIMTFKTFRPKAMLIERSFDFGESWKVYRYFAQHCKLSFPHVKKRVVNRLTDVICEQRYSAETPSTNGEVIFRVLPPSIPILDPYSGDVQDLLKLTNLRINFTELHTLGDTLLDNRPEIKEKYYYSLFDVTVRGSCSCYGHASRCLPVPGYNRSADTSRYMVHGQCECTHNTKGRNCEVCEDFYHDLPWNPARKGQPNVCKKCNCNNHADQCHFDAAVFQASGRVSGGVCDLCKHNTEGTHCQECQDFYFQDPLRDIRDPQVCQPCDCDSYGSQRNGLCEKLTDPIVNTTAGRCLCKTFVTGDRCDKCQTNYWNLDGSNPRGCEPCGCNPDGIVSDAGCDQKSGLCLCKRYVTGRNCDECYPGFYGLSADNQYGCKPCDCDIGGAFGSSCDQQTGQCKCRPHIRGKQCKEVDPGFFFARLDYYLYEAEYSSADGNALVDVREPLKDRPNYWTGEGYMRVTEGSSLEFKVKDLPFSTYYDIVVRYGARMPEVFEDISVSLIRPGQVDPDGFCSDFSTRDDIKETSLQAGASYEIIQPPSCLETNTMYTVRIDFTAYKKGKQTPEATLLIDSIMLVPNVDFVPIYQGLGLPEYMRNEFLYRRCDTMQLSPYNRQITEDCRKHTFSISAVLHNGALDCDCDRTGSTQVECEPTGGQCECKPNVVGRKCDECAPGTFGFGPNGCTPCNCISDASRSNFCNDVTGQCTCIDNVVGRTCDRCRTGFWGLPQCRQCRCNGNAETCDPNTGDCINCNNYTTGNFCERCEDGYYGDPRIGRRIPCKPCMCPNGPNTGVQHADKCTFDPRNQEVYCNCLPGYTGRNCESCIDNYYGNPLDQGGSCQACVCNNNIDVNDPGSCDGSTGECLKCLYSTEGFACEHCQPGYYGDATTQSCLSCVCNVIGTDPQGGDCDRVTGQCPCLPNVVGKACDQCAPAHWNISSSEGCSACSCDPAGSRTLECNQLDGQCSCLEGRGGQQCANCHDFNYGDPTDECFPCACDRQGSKFLQCDRILGQCQCMEGVTGFKCDRCARGTTGTLPNCVPCGECFDNWDKIIMDLRDQTHDLVKRAEDVSVTGAIKAFDTEFKEIQGNIDEVKAILSNVNYTQADIQGIQELLNNVRTTLSNNSQTLYEVREFLGETSGRIKSKNLAIQQLKNRVQDLRNLAKELKQNATNIQIQEAGGALDKIKEAQNQSQAAQNKVDGTKNILEKSENIRQNTENMIRSETQEFNNLVKENEMNLDAIEKNVLKLRGDMSDINKMVCGEATDTCSVLCGGAGCDRCGNVGCDGSVTIAKTALNLAEQAEDLLNQKIDNATQLLVPKINEARHDAHEAKMDAQDAYDEAAKARNITEDTSKDLSALLEKIKHFLIGKQSAKPDDVEKLAKEALALKIPLKPQQIQDLADKISRAVSSLTNIDGILNSTAKGRETAEQLKKEAEDASKDAQAIRKTAQDVRGALDEARAVQTRVEDAISQAKADIEDAENALSNISKSIGVVDGLSLDSLDILEGLKNRVKTLATNYAQIKDNLNQAKKEADSANDLAEEANEKAKELESNYGETSKELNDKYDDTKVARELADKLKEKAKTIYQFTFTKMNELKDLESKLKGNTERIVKLDDEIDTLNALMDEYLTTIKTRSKYYEEC